MTGWPGRPRQDPIVRFWRYVQRTDTCWTWTGALTRDGYPIFRTDEHQLAHRFSYAHHVGPIPPGHYIDHTCRTRACVNPAHLEPVRPAENNRRRASYGHRQHARQLQTGPTAGPRPTPDEWQPSLFDDGTTK